MPAFATVIPELCTSLCEKVTAPAEAIVMASESVAVPIVAPSLIFILPVRIGP